METGLEPSQGYERSRGKCPVLVEHQVLRGHVATARRAEQQRLMLTERGDGSADRTMQIRERIQRTATQ